MVRFIMDYILYVGMNVYHLHSNMVRFIIEDRNKGVIYDFSFTFQYG